MRSLARNESVVSKPTTLSREELLRFYDYTFHNIFKDNISRQNLR